MTIYLLLAREVGKRRWEVTGAYSTELAARAYEHAGWLEYRIATVELDAEPKLGQV